MRFRLRYFAAHLLLSFFVALASLYCVFGVWYPSPLDVGLGVTGILMLLLGVDVIVGPLLTLLVAKPGKRTLKMDLAIIGILQAIALGYGLYIVAQGRPVWLVYNNKHFVAVQAYEAVVRGENTSKDFSLSFSGPSWGAVSDKATDQGADAAYSQNSLVPFNERSHNAFSNALPIEILNRFNDKAKVESILLQYPESDSYIPMAAKNKSLVVLVSKTQEKLIAIVELAPW